MLELVLNDPNFRETISIRKRTGTTKIRGKMRETYAAAVNRNAVAIPAGENDVIIEGTSRIQGDFKFYFVGDKDIPERSIVQYQGADYEIREFIDRSFHGNYTLYLGKRRR